MNRRQWIIACLGLAVSGMAGAQEDPGREKIGWIRVIVYHGTNGDPKAVGARGKAVSSKTSDRLRKEERLRFKTYQFLGQEVQPLFRSYENWSQPLRPSEEVMVRFEAQGQPTKNTAELDVELWLGLKKIVKTDAKLEGDRPLFVLGPEWRGGRLIIAIALAEEPKPKS